MKIRIDPWPNQPTKVAIFTGITCNLACAMCGPGASSLWRSELNMGKYEGAEYQLRPEEQEIEVEDYDYSVLDHVTFSGGEPMLNKSTLHILSALRPQTNIHFHSNGTVLPSQEFLDLFAKFENFLLVFSIDDIEEQFEYLRWPGKWAEVVKNILWIKDHAPDNLKFAFNVVISKLNQHTYHRVEQWMLDNVPTNRAGIDTIFYTNQINGVLHTDERYNQQQSLQYLKEIDSRRGLDWQKVFPLVKL